jgi:acyl-CoA thioester hydrolase
MKNYETLIKVRYGETDAMGIAHHGSYLSWLEVGRVEFMREMGLNYTEIEDRGLALPVIEARLRYLKPALFDEEISVKTVCISLTETRIVFGYLIHKEEKNSDNEKKRPLIAHGYTVHAILGRNGRPCRIEKDIKSILEDLLVPPVELPVLRWAYSSEY